MLPILMIYQPDGTSAIERIARQIESDEDLLGLDIYIEDGEDDGQN